MTPEFKRAIAEAARWGVPVFFGRRSGDIGLITREDTLLERADGRADAWAVANVLALPPDLRTSRLYQAPASISWVSLKPYTFILWDDWTRPSEAAQLVHELAHVLVGTDPDAVEEMGALFAIQHEVTRRLKLPWLDEVANYGVSDRPGRAFGDEWGDLTTRQRGTLLRGYYAEARAAGLVDANNRATFRRVLPT